MLHKFIIENNSFFLKNAKLRSSSRFINIISYKDTPRLFNLINPELLRFNAFFYGFYYDMKDANYNLWLTVGLKKNINILFPLFYLNLNFSKLFNKIKYNNWLFLNYLVKNSFINIDLNNNNNLNKINFIYENKLNYNIQYSDDLINLTYTSGMHSVININSFSGLDYSISANYGFWFYNNLLGVADRLFIQYSFFITANENMNIGSYYLYFKFFYFVKFFKYCYIFFINSILWNRQINLTFYLNLVNIFKSYLINLVIFNYNRFFSFSNNFNLFIKFYYYFVKRNIINKYYLIYKNLLNINYLKIFMLFQIFICNINNFSFISNNFLNVLKKNIKKKKNYKIFHNFFKRIFDKSSSSLKLSLIYLSKYLDIIYFSFFKNLCLEDLLLYFKFNEAFKGNNKEYFSIMKEWVFFFFNKYRNYERKIKFLGTLNISRVLNINKFNYILNSFSRKTYLFITYFNQHFYSRGYSFYYWNKKYAYRIERKYHSIHFHSDTPKLIEFIWFDLIIYRKMHLLINNIFFRFIFLILRKNLIINISIFSSFFIIINLLFSYFSFNKLYLLKLKNKKINNILIFLNYVFLNRYLLITKKSLNFIIFKGYSKVINNNFFINKIL